MNLEDNTGQGNTGQGNTGQGDERYGININLIVAPCIFVESLLLSTNKCTYITFT